jgi:hypothetical protein
MKKWPDLFDKFRFFAEVSLDRGAMATKVHTSRFSNLAILGSGIKLLVIFSHPMSNLRLKGGC